MLELDTNGNIVVENDLDLSLGEDEDEHYNDGNNIRNAIKAKVRENSKNILKTYNKTKKRKTMKTSTVNKHSGDSDEDYVPTRSTAGKRYSKRKERVTKKNATADENQMRKNKYFNRARYCDMDTFDEKDFMERTEDGSAWQLKSDYSTYGGKLRNECEHCGALRFDYEVNEMGYTKCCEDGNIKLPGYYIYSIKFERIIIARD